MPSSPPLSPGNLDCSKDQCSRIVTAGLKLGRITLVGSEASQAEQHPTLLSSSFGRSAGRPVGRSAVGIIGLRTSGRFLKRSVGQSRMPFRLTGAFGRPIAGKLSGDARER
jgi:hypothetical protein